jgi:alpha-tubulin suppressor-like RCC1 family protein
MIWRSGRSESAREGKERPVVAIVGRVGVSGCGKRMRALAISVLLGAGLCAGPHAASAAASAPVISGLQASPPSVESGGVTTVSASVSGAKTCTLSASKRVSGLPATFACEGEPAAVSRELTMPANTGAKPAKYKVTLTATGAEGTVNAETSVSVRPTATQVASGSGQSCALLSTGHIDCWGEGKSGQLGNGGQRISDKPVQVASIGNASQVAAGGNESCALLSTGHIDCWGEGSAGQLGDGNHNNSDTPVEVQGIASASQVTVGYEDACAVLSSGHIDCWGDNENGELGDGNDNNSETPVEVQGISDATHVSPGFAQSCAVLSTGQIDCWGRNRYGELGTGTTESSDTPVEVHGITNATQISAGFTQSCAVLSTGHIDCWGDNEHGELGNGTTETSDTPVEVENVTDGTQAAASDSGDFFSCALLSTGHIDCWGWEIVGQLGDGSNSYENSDTPVEVQDISNGSQVAAGGGGGCALLSTGQVDCWGDDRYGQLGDGQKGRVTEKDTPVEVLGL